MEPFNFIITSAPSYLVERLIYACFCKMLIKTIPKEAYEIIKWLLVTTSINIRFESIVNYLNFQREEICNKTRKHYF